MTAVWAHRGASSTERENTVAAFEAAVRLGADGVELDVRRARDGRLLVHHDLLPAVVPPWVPTLAEALDACGDLLVNVELKEPVGVEALPVLVGRNVLVSSFDLPSIDAIAGAVPTAWLVMAPAPRIVATCVAHGHVALHPHHRVVRRRLVDAAHAAGLALNTWTVDDPARMRRLAAIGVDAIVTNDPALALRTLRP